MPFAYLRDPLFLTCFAAYWLHRVAARGGWSPWWLRYYLNDLICIPFWVPMMLWAARCLGLRKHDEAPEAGEVVIPLVLWAVIFEVVLPITKAWQGQAFADPYDVLCYAIGAWVAFHFWRWRYAAADTAPSKVLEY